MNSNNTMTLIQKLTGRDNWATWSFAAKAYLEHEDLWEIIENGPTDKIKDKRAKSKLILLVDPILFIHIQEAQSAKEVWYNLSKAFQDSGLLRKVGLLKDLINTTLENSNSVENYVNKIMTSAHKLRNISFEVNDEWLGTLMLAGLPDMYKPMIMGIESSGVKISADLIKTKLLQEVKQPDTTAFYTNLPKKPSSFKKQSQSKPKGPRCFQCNKYGHVSKNCWYRKDKSENNNNKDNGFIAAFSAMHLNDIYNWYVDSGASAHMTMHREWLEDETTPPVSVIKIADSKLLHVASCGNVTIQLENNSTIQVRNVLYIPELSTNLLSVSKIIKAGYNVIFDKTGCLIQNQHKQILASANIINDTYRLNVMNKFQAMAASVETDSYLWHLRMGHLNMKDVNKLPKLATGVNLSPQQESYTCITCLQGKQSRQPFPSSGSRAHNLLELIHTDLCGPMQTTSIGGARYFATFIDDYSHKVFVYFIKHKFEVLDKFIEFKNLVENQSNKRIKVLRSDNGTEYMSRNFDNFLKKGGILHQTSNPYTPQQNGLSERMNRTLIERAKCMLFNAGLQKEFWAEAVATAAHIINRSPTQTLSNTTPEEVWSGTKPDLSYMKIFGCKAMVHTPKEKRQKLDSKSSELIFVGYSETTKGYRFIEPKSKKAIMSRDVVFLEGSIKRNIVPTAEPEIKKDINMNNKMKNKVNLPLTELQPEAKSENQSVSKSDSDSGSYYDDPNDDTYLPDETIETPEKSQVHLIPKRRMELYDHTSTTYLCMNTELLPSLLYSDPQDLDEALKSEKAHLWKQAMSEEYDSLIENNTWSLVDKPVGKKIIPCKWVYKSKLDENGNVIRYKARLVIKGYQQKKGIDYNEIYAPVVRYSSIRYLIGLATKYNLEIHQMDAVSAFLQGDIKEEIFMAQPPSFEQGEKVCRLNRSIYGLKQASRQWNKKLNNALLHIGLSRSNVDPCIYYRILSKEDILFITVYVDDLACFFNNKTTMDNIKYKLQNKFQMKDLGRVKQCVGFRIIQKEKEISLDQSIYIEKILNRFKMQDCKPVYTPCEANTQLKKAEHEGEVLKNIPYHEAVGCLLYLSQGTRPDIAYIVNTLSKYNNKPTAQHWSALKRVLRYLKATIHYKLTFKRDDSEIVGYCDADWGSQPDDRRSCTGYIFLFQGATISWGSKRQQTVALSSTEAEYMSLAASVQEAMWLKQLQQEFWPEFKNNPMYMYCDNQSCISLSGNESYQARSKHIDIRYHFIREKITANQIVVEFMKSENMLADILTKGLHRPKHEGFTNAMGLRPGEDVER